MSKIFSIGFNKTGITSLAKAIYNLKYNICPINIMFSNYSPYLNDFLNNQYDKIFSLIEKHDFFYDRPWNHNDFYKILNDKYPDSKFILTIRNAKNWHDSYQRFAKLIHLRNRWFYKKISLSLYGIEDFLSSENIMIEKFNQRNEEVANYFKNKNNLLIFNTEQGDGYEKLCNFLNRPILNLNFPHERITNNSKLHICTPLFRYENLEKIYKSIPNSNEVIWHIAYSNKREIPFLNENKNCKVVFYSVECDDKDTVKKRNEIFKHIKNGYFCLLDDDTEFHPLMYAEYKKCININLVGMLIGSQLNKNGTFRLLACTPQNCKIDTGNVLCHFSCLNKCLWPSEKTKFENRDYLFWKSVHEFFNNKCYIYSNPISYYNKLK